MIAIPQEEWTQQKVYKLTKTEKNSSLSENCVKTEMKKEIKNIFD